MNAFTSSLQYEADIIRSASSDYSDENESTEAEKLYSKNVKRYTDRIGALQTVKDKITTSFDGFEKGMQGFGGSIGGNTDLSGTGGSGVQISRQKKLKNGQIK